MSELIAGKCPNCGSNVNLPSELESTFCAYCGSNIKVKEAVEKLKIELSGKIEVDGIASLNKMYKNAEDYTKLGEYEKAYDTYISIILDNPGEVKAYYLALDAISYKMNRTADYEFPSGHINDINTCLDRLQKLDTNGEYGDFIKKFTEYINILSREQPFLLKVKYYNDTLSSMYREFGAYAFDSVESNYNAIKMYYENLTDDLKSKYASTFEACTESYKRYPRKRKSIFDVFGF